MSYKTAKWIFIIGTLTSAILFLALTVDTHRQIGALTHADQLSDEVVAGKKVFQKYNCNDCHTMLGFGGYYAPDLTKVYKRRGENYIRRILREPEVVLANSFRKMANQHLTAEEIDKLVAFFKWTSNIENNDWPPQDSKKRRSAGARRLIGGSTLSPGAALFKENGCFDCHKLNGVGGDTGPALNGVGARLDADRIRQQLMDPTVLNPDSEMPAFGDQLSEDDINLLVEFLTKLQGGEE